MFMAPMSNSDSKKDLVIPSIIIKKTKKQINIKTFIFIFDPIRPAANSTNIHISRCSLKPETIVAASKRVNMKSNDEYLKILDMSVG